MISSKDLALEQSEWESLNNEQIETIKQQYLNENTASKNKGV